MDITIQHPWFKRALGPLIPSRLFDQFFGEGLLEYDLLPLFSSTISPYYRQSLFRSVLESGISEVRSDRDKFTIMLDVKHFSPEDLTVKVIDDFVEIHGKHSERQAMSVPRVPCNRRRNNNVLPSGVATDNRHEDEHIFPLS
nr:PREDICTED: alpha-crystallin A chain [Opisthocomus hoazin]